MDAEDETGSGICDAGGGGVPSIFVSGEVASAIIDFLFDCSDGYLVGLARCRDFHGESSAGLGKEHSGCAGHMWGDVVAESGKTTPGLTF